MCTTEYRFLKRSMNTPLASPLFMSNATEMVSPGVRRAKAVLRMRRSSRFIFQKFCLAVSFFAVSDSSTSRSASFRMARFTLTCSFDKSMP